MLCEPKEPRENNFLKNFMELGYFFIYDCETKYNLIQN